MYCAVVWCRVMEGNICRSNIHWKLKLEIGNWKLEIVKAVPNRTGPRGRYLLAVVLNVKDVMR